MKCKYCKKEIEHLDFSSKVENYGSYDGNDWNTRERGDWSEINFYCPHCAKLLTTNEDEADKYFEGKI